MKNNKNILVFGDILAIAIVTIIGFVTHGEGGLSYLPRMAAAFFPLVITWLILAPRFDLFNTQVASNPKTLWLPAFAALFAAPLSLVFRGLALNAPIIPIFAVVFTTTSAFGLVVWRIIYFFVIGRNK
ncbi:MAG: DUF3054 domain-containing protein [Anaerolineales bacterium]